MCADWVHARHTVERGGRSWPTWHPPRDPRYRCAFGHEHGSNPRAFAYFRRTGMPALGHIGAFAGSDEAHAGFKVFVVNRDRKGLAWMVVLHQGSGSPKRGTVRFHSLETWLFKQRRGRLVAHTRHMADFGEALPNCPGTELREHMRLLPSPACESVYEEWDTGFDVGGVFRGRPGFGIDNAITQFDAAAPDADHLQQGLRLRAERSRRLGLLLQGRQAGRVPPALGGRQPRRQPLPDGRVRQPLARRPPAGGVTPPAGRPVGRVLRCRERLRHGAAERRRHLPRRPRAQLEELRVPRVLRAAERTSSAAPARSQPSGSRTRR